MIEKSAEMKIHEQADAMMQSFRNSVRKAQQDAKEAGVPVTILVRGDRYNVLPNGDIELAKKHSGG